MLALLVLVVAEALGALHRLVISAARSRQILRTAYLEAVAVLILALQLELTLVRLLQLAKIVEPLLDGARVAQRGLNGLYGLFRLLERAIVARLLSQSTTNATVIGRFAHAYATAGTTKATRFERVLHFEDVYAVRVDLFVARAFESRHCVRVLAVRVKVNLASL